MKVINVIEAYVLVAVIAGLAQPSLGKPMTKADKTQLEAASYDRQARELRQSNDYAGAIELESKAITLEPRDSLYLESRAVWLMTLGDRRQAVLDYMSAIKVDPKWYKPYIGRGECRAAFGDEKGAMQDYDEAIRLQPLAEQAFYLRGKVKLKLGDVDGAKRDFFEAVRIYPEYAAAQNQLAGLLLKSVLPLQYSTPQKQHSVLEDVDRAVKNDPKFAFGYINRGICRSTFGDNKGAMEDYDQAIKLEPKNDLAYCLRGKLKVKTDDREGAKNDFQQALLINPTCTTAKHALKSLSQQDSISRLN